MLRVANTVEDCDEDEDCRCEGQGCINIEALDEDSTLEDSDESVDDEEIEDEAEEH